MPRLRGWTAMTITQQVKVQARHGVRTHIVVLDLTNNDLYNIDGVLHNYNFIDGDCPQSQAGYDNFLKNLPEKDEVLLVTVEVASEWQFIQPFGFVKIVANRCLEAMANPRVDAEVAT